jgi:hypothetical protein
MKWSLFKTAAVKPSVAAKPAPSPFHAVEIVSLGACCQAAREAREVRFLSKDAPPTLPLAACDIPAACRCRYRHHEDRRSFNRRASDQVWGSASPVASERERRRSTGRRATDRQASPL